MSLQNTSSRLVLTAPQPSPPGPIGAGWRMLVPLALVAVTAAVCWGLGRLPAASPPASTHPAVAAAPAPAAPIAEAALAPPAAALAAPAAPSPPMAQALLSPPAPLSAAQAAPAPTRPHMRSARHRVEGMRTLDAGDASASAVASAPVATMPSTGAPAETAAAP